MVWQTMFNTKAFSPTTTLTQEIGPSDTRIYVADVSVFPAVPTLATIGIASDLAEVVRVTAIGNNFIDVERGYVGAAKSFTANSPISRNFSSKDQDIIQANLQFLKDNALFEVKAENIPANSISNDKLAQTATNTIKGRKSVGQGNIEDLSASDVRTMLDIQKGADVTNTVLEAAGDTTIADNDKLVLVDVSVSSGSKIRTVLWSAIKTALNNLFVPKTRTVNNKELSEDISLTAADVGADATGTATSAVSNHNSSSSAHSAQFGNKQDNITVSGMLKGTGTSVVAATAGTDYASPALPRTVTLGVAAWTGAEAPFQQTVSVSGATETNVKVISPAPASVDEYASCGVKATTEGAGAITFACTTVPENDLTVNVLIVG